MRARTAAGLRGALLGLCIVLAATGAHAASAVFDGDPVDPGSGLPYEMLPGTPLVRPGSDGRVGTADDVIDGGLVGDIDLVVRLGAGAGGSIPAPAVRRGGLATAVAGPPGVGTAIPFSVYLSNGVVTATEPYGSLLAAADMEGLPVVVTLFADLNGDGAIGPTGTKASRQVGMLRELEAVGHAVALFNGGVASGTIAVTAGAPARRGGLRLVATAMALTGTYDVNFLGGFVPNGPVISTAQPYLPERDPQRVFSQDIGPLEAGGTLNPSPRPAGIPDPTVLDLSLPTDGSSPTVDTARAVSGPAVCARLVESPSGPTVVAETPAELVLAVSGPRARRRLRLVAVDRFGNPTTPPQPLSIEIVADGPVSVLPDRDRVPSSERLSLTGTRRRSLAVRATGAGTGAVRVLLDGAECQRLEVSGQAERADADAWVGPFAWADFATIADAVAAAVDRNDDGRIAVAVSEGVYRESLRVTRPIELLGAGRGRTVIDAGGRGAALALANAAASATGLTVTGGTIGISLEAPLALRGVEARANIGAGIHVGASGASATDCLTRENGGAGLSVAAAAVVDACVSEGNVGPGLLVSGATGVTVRDSDSVANGGDGIEIADAIAPTLSGNACAGNLGTGITVASTDGGMLLGNRASGNDDNGLRLNKSDGAIVDGNDCSANGGYGMRIDRSTADFDAAAGEQPPPGNNDVSGNRKGAIVFD